MFPPVVMVADVGWDGFDGGVEEGGAKGEPGDVLKHICMLNSLRGRLSPGEGGVAGDQNSGNGDWVELILTEASDDDHSGVQDIAG